MGKRPRTPHFITGIGDGKVHDSNNNNHGNDDVSRLRGNKISQNNNHNNNNNNNNNNAKAVDEKDSNSNEYDRHHPQNRHSNNNNGINNRKELLQRIEDPLRDGAGIADRADSWRDTFHEPNTASPDNNSNNNNNNNNMPIHNRNTKMDLMNVGGLGINVGDIVRPSGSATGPTTGPWQVSAFAFLGIVVVVAIVLHFVSETASGSGSGGGTHKGGAGGSSSSSRNHHGHPTGNNSRPYQYRRKQRQRRMQRLRKKKTDEWSDDEEPVQNGAGLLSLSSNATFFGTGRGLASGSFDGGGGYGSPDHSNNLYSLYDGYDHEAGTPHHDYDDYNDGHGSSNNNNNNNNNVYHQSEYYRQPNSHLSAQDISLRRTGFAAARDPYGYNYPSSSASPAGAGQTTPLVRNGGVVGVVPTYKSPSVSKYLMMEASTTTSTAASKTPSFRSATSPQRGISPMNSYSSAGSGSRHQQQRRRHRHKNSPNASVSSPLWEIDKHENHRRSSSSNNHNNTNAGGGGNSISETATTATHLAPVSGRLRTPSTPDRFPAGALASWHQQHGADGPSNASLLHQSALLIPASKDNRAPDGANANTAQKKTTELGARLLVDSGSRFSSFASIGDTEAEGIRGPSNNNTNNNKNTNTNNTTTIGEHELEQKLQRNTTNRADKDARGSTTTDDREANETWSRALGGGYGEIETFDAPTTLSQSSHHSRGSNHRNNSRNPSPSPTSMYEETFASSVQTHRHQDIHQKSLLLTPGNCDETPIIGNARKTIAIHDGGIQASFDEAALLPIQGTATTQQPDGNTNDGGGNDLIPYVPVFEEDNTGLSPSLLSTNPPPRSIIMDELRLVEMETGNSTHWDIERSEHSSPHEDHGSFPGDCSVEHPDVTAKNEREGYQSSDQEGLSNEEGSDISIPSGDPRKSIIHKRQNLTMATDAATSLQSSIDFDELQLQEVIGGGGFGQVWKATWRGTPVAVKVLTGSAQNTHIAKAILEEFKAEINLLKGMRHPNICLYMGACVTPPNRAIITELAANGSAWDSLRLPLTPPYSAADGTPRGSWPLKLYLPGQHGIPPSSHGNSESSEICAPIPPRGTWPWELVKRVSCGAARGMAYLHSGNPPVLHRDLKSANLLLDESYTTKVCDFGLSRLKAQARSMTANCGTVQWMAPEVLANRSYDEKADVYSFGIIVWELLSRECPYEGMTAIQCALAVLNRDKRPEIPKWCPPGLHALIKSCIKKDPSDRPSFAEVIKALDAI